MSGISSKLGGLRDVMITYRPAAEIINEPRVYARRDCKVCMKPFDPHSANQVTCDKQSCKDRHKQRTAVINRSKSNRTKGKRQAFDFKTMKLIQ